MKHSLVFLITILRQNKRRSIIKLDRVQRPMPLIILTLDQSQLVMLQMRRPIGHGRHRLQIDLDIAHGQVNLLIRPAVVLNHLQV